MRTGSLGVRRRFGFTLAAGISLVLGIGVTTATFTVLNAVALRPLPYPEADRLLWMTEVLRKNSTDEVTITGHYLEWRRLARSFTALAGYNYQARNLTGAGEAMQLQTAKASATLLPILGVVPALGRNFTKEEDYKGHDQVALLTAEFWERQFGGSSEILGKSLLLDGAPFTVIGILPRGFVFPGADPVQMITPLGKDEAAEREHRAGSIIFNVIGRLKPEATPAQARAEMEVLTSRLPLPAFGPTITLKMMTLRSRLFGDAKSAGIVLVAAAGFLLLIACANVSNMLLTRLLQRNQELAIRTALGASRAQLIRQLLGESARLGALACGGGVVLALWLRRILFALMPYRLPGLESLPFDWRVAGFAAALGMLATLAFGLLPAFRATDFHLSDALKTGAGGVRSLRVLSMVGAAEIAIVLILSTGAGLMLESFWKIRYVNLGFQPDRLVVATLKLAGPRYRDKVQQHAFMTGLLERVRGLAGVDLAAAAAGADLPPGSWHATNSFAIEGRNQPLGGARPIANYPQVSADYFAIMGIPLLSGRLLADSDAEGSTPSVVVNRALAQRYFPGEDAIGRRVRPGPDTRPWATIVGIAGDVKGSGLAVAAEPAIYIPYPQSDGSTDVGLIIRSPLDAGVLAGELRKAVAALDSNQPVATIQTMNDRLSESVSLPRFTAALLFAFAGLAVVLGWIGVYSVMGCRVRRQIREIAVRLALGATGSHVTGHVVRQGLAMVAPGLFLGLLGSVAIGKVLSGMLYQVPSNDPVILFAVSAGLAAAALLACWIPAARAARVDPLTPLRHD
jgi:predicted permease